MRVRVLSAHDSTDPNDFNGTPHRLVRTLTSLGVDTEGFKLTGIEHDALRFFWGIAASVGERKLAKGYQYSRIAQLVRDIRYLMSDKHHLDVVISFYQNPPRTISPNSELVMYVDGTLLQLFSSYPEVADVSPKRKLRAFYREKKSYEASVRIVTKTNETRQVLIKEYLVSPDKIFVVPPPPNIDLAYFDNFRVRPERAKGCIRFVAIAKDYERKNIRECIVFLDEIHSMGISVSLDIVGLAEVQIPGDFRRDWITAHGHIDAGDKRKLAEILVKANIGLLLSAAEIAGIALLEYQAAGNIVICSGKGGMPDVLMTDECYIMNIDDPNSRQRLATNIASYAFSNELDRMQAVAWDQRNRVPKWDDVASIIIGENSRPQRNKA